MLSRPPSIRIDEAQVKRLAYRIEDAVIASGLSRTTIYELITAGKLRSIKAAGRRLILADDLRAFLEAQREVAA